MISSSPLVSCQGDLEKEERDLRDDCQSEEGDPAEAVDDLHGLGVSVASSLANLEPFVKYNTKAVLILSLYLIQKLC